MSQNITVKHNYNKGFTIVDNTVIRDKELSWKAKGIMIYLMSLPEDWAISLTEIQNHATDGRDAFRAGINELISFGYVTKEVYRQSGKFDKTQYSLNIPPRPENPDTEKPDTVNPALLNTNNTKNLKNTKDLSKDKSCPEIIIDPMASIRKTVSDKKKPNVGIEAYKMIDSFSSDTTIRSLLKDYFGIRVRKGLQVIQWKMILDDLKKYTTNDTSVVHKIEGAIAGGYMQIIPNWEKETPATKRPTFDNTANHKAKQFDHDIDELALDEFGQPIRF